MTVDTDRDARRREAASWFARLNQKRVTASDIQAFGQWRRDAQNAAAYARIETLWLAAETLADDADAKAMTQDALARADIARRGRKRLAKVFVPIGAVAGALVLAVATGLWTTRAPVYQTGFGERRVVSLPDGSRVTLDTESRIRVKFSAETRAVDLAGGQAFFDVVGNPARPFIVTAGDAHVVAVGTRFGVRRSGDGALVTLVQGQVEIGDKNNDAPRWRLTPGQQVRTSTPGSPVRNVDASAETSWTTGRLIFDGDTIEDATAEVNRYSREKVLVAAPDVASIPVSGAFNAGDVESYVSALTALYPVVADRSRPGQILIRQDPRRIRAEP